MKGLVLDQWLGVFVPAGTPPAIAARLNTEIGKALADRRSATASCKRPRTRSVAPPSVRAVVRDDYDKYERLVKELNIKAN